MISASLEGSLFPYPYPPQHCSPAPFQTRVWGGKKREGQSFTLQVPWSLQLAGPSTCKGQEVRVLCNVRTLAGTCSPLPSLAESGGMAGSASGVTDLLCRCWG